MDDEKLKSFLKETKYCDFNHPDIQKLLDDFRKKYPDKKDLAVALFYYVRDNILYRVGLWNKKASETLEEGQGVCTSSANLLVALMRGVGIPAGYGVMRVDGQKYFGPVMLDMFRDKVSRNSIHIYCYAYLDNKWIKCDPSDDKEFCENTSHFNPTSQLVDWDGKSDARLNLDPLHILKDEGPIDDIDYIIRKKPRNARGIPLKVANLYIQFLRKNKVKIKETKELEVLFKQWLKENFLIYYYLYFIASTYRNLKKKIFNIK